MNGKWKTKLNGYSYKGYKRKKQTTNHFQMDCIYYDFMNMESGFDSKYRGYIKKAIYKNPTRAKKYSSNKKFALKSLNKKRRHLEKLFLNNHIKEDFIFLYEKNTILFDLR